MAIRLSNVVIVCLFPQLSGQYVFWNFIRGLTPVLFHMSFVG